MPRFVYEPCVDCGFKMPQQAWRTGHDGGVFCTCANCGSDQIFADS